MKIEDAIDPESGAGLCGICDNPIGGEQATLIRVHNNAYIVHSDCAIEIYGSEDSDE